MLEQYESHQDEIHMLKYVLSADVCMPIGT